MAVGVRLQRMGGPSYVNEHRFSLVAASPAYPGSVYDKTLYRRWQIKFTHIKIVKNFTARLRTGYGGHKNGRGNFAHVQNGTCF